MLRRFLKDSAVYGVAALLSRGVSLILVPVYTRLLEPRDYGVVDILVVAASLANLTVALEVSQAVARFWGDAPSPAARVAYASTALWFTVAAYGAFWLAAGAAGSWVSPWLLGRDTPGFVYQLAVAWACINGIFYLVQNQFRWELRPRAYAVASLTLTTTTLLLALLMVWGLRLGVRGVMAAQLGGSIAGAATGFWLAGRTYLPQFSGAKLREMLRFSLPLVPSGVAVFVALYADRLAIRQFLTLDHVGLFGVGYRVASVAGLVMLGFQGALTPLIYSHHQEAGTPAQLARIFRVFVAIALFICLALTVYAREIVQTFTTARYLAAAEVIPALAPAILLANMYIFAPGLAIAKRTVPMAALNVAGAALNVVLNLLLVPSVGIVGAALATLLSAAAVFASYMALSQRLYPVPHHWPTLAGAVVLLCVAGWGASRIALDPTTTIVLKAAVLAGFAALLVQLGLVQRAELRQGLALARPLLGRRAA